VAIAALGVVQLLGQPHPPNLSLAAVVLAGVAVGLLPLAPLPALLVLLLIDAGHQVLVGIPPFAAFLATIVAVFELTRAGGRGAVLGGYAATLAMLGVLLPDTDRPITLLIPLAFFAVAAAGGVLVRQVAARWPAADEPEDSLERDEEHREQEHREQEHLASLASLASANARLATAAERSRLARELHGVVSHGVSLMVLQAEAARRVLATRPDQATAALDMVAMTGRRAVADLQHMLGVLQAPEPAEPLVDLATLVEPVRQTGLAVELLESGDPERCPADVRLVAYGVVQEALTNVLKHANATAVTVTVRHHPDLLDVEVTDDGAGGHGLGSASGPGQGIAALRERITALGGSLDTGPAERGFRVHAKLPFPDAAAPGTPPGTPGTPPGTPGTPPGTPGTPSTTA
jgi:signal transduction histidine kinase